MAAYSVPMYNLYTYIYKGGWSGYLDAVVPNNTFKVSDEDTYFVIASPYQQKEAELIRKDPRFKIVYEGPKAVNRNYKNTGPRNTLFILEKNDSLSTMPQV